MRWGASVSENSVVVDLHHRRSVERWLHLGSWDSEKESPSRFGSALQIIFAGQQQQPASALVHEEDTSPFGGVVHFGREWHSPAEECPGQQEVQGSTQALAARFSEAGHGSKIESVVDNSVRSAWAVQVVVGLVVWVVEVEWFVQKLVVTVDHIAVGLAREHSID